jgi:hypothetical protein
MFYKKGTIVPRSLIRCKNRKTQHLWTFGADVEIQVRKVTMVTDGSCFCRQRDFIGGRGGRPRVYDHAELNGVDGHGFRVFIQA